MYSNYKNEKYYRIGNVAIFLANHIKNLTKLKLLTLFYILDEISIKRTAIPMLNLRYKIWKLAPISEEIFIELSFDNLGKLSDFIKKDGDNFVAVSDFDELEFSDYKLEFLNEICKKYENCTFPELQSYTNRKDGLWYEEAKANNILNQLEKGDITTTEIVLDMSKLLAHDPFKQGLYFEYLSLF